MEPDLSFSAFAVTCLIGAAHGVLAALVILGLKRGRPQVNRLFAALMLITSVHLAFQAYHHDGWHQAFPHLIRVISPLNYVDGPLLYLFTVAVVTPGFRWKPAYWLHFAPALARALYSAPFFLQDGESKRQWLLEFSQAIPLESYILGAGWRAQRLIYIAFALAAVIRAWRAAGARQPRHSLAWLSALIGVFILNWAQSLGRYLALVDLSLPRLGVWFDALMIYALAYFSLSRWDRLIPPREAKKYRKSTLSPQQARTGERRLLALMQDDQPHRDSRLSLNELARRLAIHPHHLSQIINERLARNFFDFINDYRVEDVKRALTTEAGRATTLESLAFEAGFNSTSSFNAAFKKRVGMTPSQFRAQASQEPVQTTTDLTDNPISSAD